MKKIIYYLLLTIIFAGCNNTISREERKCRQTVSEQYKTWEEHVHGTFSNFEKADISLDSLRNTYMLRSAYQAVTMHTRYINELEEYLTHSEDSVIRRDKGRSLKVQKNCSPTQKKT